MSNINNSKVGALILTNLSDNVYFPSCLEDFGETTLQLLTNGSQFEIQDVDHINTSLKITVLLLKILRGTSCKEKSTSKNDIEHPHEILKDKLYSGQVVANTWYNAVSNFVNGLNKSSVAWATSYHIFEEQTCESPHSSKSNLVLKEFISNYAENHGCYYWRKLCHIINWYDTAIYNKRFIRDQIGIKSRYMFD